MTKVSKELSLKSSLCGDMVEEAAKELGLELKEGFRLGVETGFIHGWKAALRKYQETQAREWKIMLDPIKVSGWIVTEGPQNGKVDEEIRVREAIE